MVRWDNVIGLAVLVALWFAQSVQAQTNAFPSGVVSGDVTDQAAILWCRTAEPQTVRLEVATEESFAAPQFSTFLTTSADQNLVARQDVTGLSPGTGYFFRFAIQPGGPASPTGRFRTAPAAATAQPFRFVFSGDSDARAQPFVVMGFAANEQPDFWVWLGDIIYADVPARGLGVAKELEDYRAKYRQNLGDPYIQAISRAAPVWTGWDDHEVINDYDGGDPEPYVAAGQIETGYRAFFENLPIRAQNVEGDRYRVYRSFRYGALAEFFILDERQYRSADAGRLGAFGFGSLDPYGYFLPSYSPDFIRILRDPSRTLLGHEQLEWLKHGLATSTAQYKFIINPLPMTSLLIFPEDRWDGYDAERYDLLRGLDLLGVSGVIVLTTDSHANTFNPDVTYYLRTALKATFSNGFAIPEFVAGPIGTATAGSVLREAARNLLGADQNPLAGLVAGLLGDFAEWRVSLANGLKFLDSNKYAYLLVDVTSDGVTLTHRGVETGATESNAIIRDLYITRLNAAGRAR